MQCFKREKKLHRHFDNEKKGNFSLMKILIYFTAFSMFFFPHGCIEKWLESANRFLRSIFKINCLSIIITFIGLFFSYIQRDVIFTLNSISFVVIHVKKQDELLCVHCSFYLLCSDFFFGCFYKANCIHICCDCDSLEIYGNEC